MKNENYKSNVGYTLLELLIYIAIFAATAGILTGILATFVRIQGQQTASAAVTQELSFVQTTIQRLVREAVNIENPPGVASSTLVLRMASSTLDPTIISSDGNFIYLKQGAPAPQPLTSDRVKVSQFEVAKYENPGGHAVVQIDLSLTYNSQRLYQQITRNLKTSIGRVTAATFDDSLIPNADNAFSVGVFPYRWKDAAFSGNLTVGGNVGIGTTNPLSTLDVSIPHAASINRTITAESVSGSNRYGLGLKYWTNAVGTTFRTLTEYEGTTEYNTLSLSGGNVGIGTASPGYKLDVNGTARVIGGLYISTPGGFWLSGKTGTSGLNASTTQSVDAYHPMIRQTTSSGHVINLGGLGDVFGFFGYDVNRVVNGYDYSMVMNLANGNVGIGTTNPGSYKLYINGSGYLNATAWVYSSDIRLKENINYLQSGLSVIENLKPAQFDFINGDKKQVGFIAQDVQEILPDIVTEGPNGMLGMKTDSIIPYLVKAIQEQQKEIEELKVKLNY